ncbi:ImmA/IrrE family metallo-endopeptidase [Psychrobacter sp. 1U2]|uniref:ImmA/IrrE family metallo-endopeptidase n=1 Tax=Psychrobacter sp. 1U2 TaxID=3453577 RepID=UPI003F45D801|tara:strand:+ start:860 stop:2104 length:1245 start_codon:yes stop_codon:yes gene_type:complete
MILNSFEFKLIEQKIEKIEETILEVKRSSSMDSFLLQIEIDSLNAFLNKLVKERDFYLKTIQDFRGEVLENDVLLLYPENLLYIRIANQVSQEEIADFLEVSIEEIKRQEEYLYKKLDPILLSKINKFVTEKVTSNLNTNTSGINWENFPIKEMLKRQWLPSQVTDLASIIKVQFEEIFGNSGYELALHRKFNFNGNSPNIYSLLAWQIQVLSKAKEITKQSQVPSFDNDLAWLNQLVRISTSPTGPLEAQEFLLSKGIILIVVPHLPLTYLDGAAMLLPNTAIPVIGLTLRHDRLDNFWFVLFHELGHIFLHLNEERNIIFDEEMDIVTDQIEIEADKFALENLISLEQWNMCISRFYQDEEKLNEDARNLKIHPSIIAGRIRKENDDYRVFNEQIGSKQVRKLFWDNEYDSE